ncbi:MAG: hypothetical protein ACJ79L_06110 [Anaeromyxobacteraceae bacterium]
MSTRTGRIAMVNAVLALAAAPVVPAAAGGCGPTVVEELTGPIINGLVPGGRAIADETRFLCGGPTILTVEVTNVDLPDGTVLDVSLDFRPLGTITLGGMNGILAADLGHFAVSNDEVRVLHDGGVILIGPFFR